VEETPLCGTDGRWQFPEEREVVQKGDRGVKPYRLLTLVKERDLIIPFLPSF
jgi:hypothetical protein